MLATHGAALAVCAMMLASAGQPLFAEDTWLHLSLGAAYAEHGPWLDADPLLYTAQGPPAPAAWLFDLALHGLARAGGFTALRVAHVLLVGAILGLAWGLLRRVSGSALWASFASVSFVSLAGYRLFQLRPHLASLLAALVLLHLLLADRERSDALSAGRVAAIAALFALWANLHGAFVLGLLLLAAALLGDAVQAWLTGGGAAGRRRLVALALVLGVSVLASLANPSGFDQHLLYFAAGSDSPALAAVADEWARFPLLEWPRARIPPTPLSWMLVWGIGLGLLALLLARVRRLRREGASALAPGELRLWALSGVACAGLLSAVRLSWLGIVPLLLLGARVGPRLAGARAASGVALGALALVPAFVWLGPWPLISAGVHRASYRLPYAVSKLDAHAVWLLRDAGLEGHLFNGYATGNFLGYWLAPRMQVFIDGSLNVPPPVMDALHEIEQRADAREIGALLDHHGVDVFFGTGLPLLPLPGRPQRPTTTLLERMPGWILVFRSARSALYLRDDARNRPNLEKLAGYYADQRVPFDPARGFEAERVVREAPLWAAANGLIPVDFTALEQASTSMDPTRRARGLERLAETWALLGVYERAVSADRRRLRFEPGAVSARRRLVFSRLHQGRWEDAREEAEALKARADPQDVLSNLLVDAARGVEGLPEAERSTGVARLPLLWPGDAQRVLGRYMAAETRGGG